MNRLQQHPAIAGTVAALLTAAVFLVHFQMKYGLNTPPSATGDEPSYDSIGWEISRGHGFSENFADPEFRRPYDALATTQPDLMVLPEQLPGTVTYRPPLFPTVIAGLNLILDRQFVGTRIWNVAMLSASAGLLVWFLLRFATVGSAVVGFFLFVVVDFRTRLYARAILTEASAVLLTTLLTLCLIRLTKRGSYRNAGVAGIVMALAVLNRTATALWVPTLAAGMLLLLNSRTGVTSDVENSDGVRKPNTLAVVAVWLMTTALVCCPWAIRNMRVLNAPMPLGAQGMMELPAGFSDSAWENSGIWAPIDREPSTQQSGHPLTRPQRERLRADVGKAKAIQWIRDNPLRSFLLGFLKIWNAYRPRQIAEWFIAVFAFIGIAATFRQQATHVFLLLHAANAFAIAVTWSVEGRFVVPLLFSIHVWAAVGCWYLMTTAVHRRRASTSG
jgi:hypothetical protein